MSGFEIQRFGTIRNNTALKRQLQMYMRGLGFGTIRNNTALKLVRWLEELLLRFGTIRNNTALKPCAVTFS